MAGRGWKQGRGAVSLSAHLNFSSSLHRALCTIQYLQLILLLPCLKVLFNHFTSCCLYLLFFSPVPWLAMPIPFFFVFNWIRLRDLSLTSQHHHLKVINPINPGMLSGGILRVGSNGARPRLHLRDEMPSYWSSITIKGSSSPPPNPLSAFASWTTTGSLPWWLTASLIVSTHSWQFD